MKASQSLITRFLTNYICLLVMFAGACGKLKTNRTTKDDFTSASHINSASEANIPTAAQAEKINLCPLNNDPEFYFERYKEQVAKVSAEYSPTNIIIEPGKIQSSFTDAEKSNAVGVVLVTIITNAIPLIVDVSLHFQFYEGKSPQFITPEEQAFAVHMMVGDIQSSLKEFIIPKGSPYVRSGGVFFNVDAPAVGRKHISIYDWKKNKKLTNFRQNLKETWDLQINTGSQ